MGALLPALGGIADRVGPARLLPAFVACGAAGGLLTLADLLPVVMLGMAMMALGMFSTVTACQLLIPRIASHNRGTATSLHLTVYYLLGGLGAYLPGLALSAGWATWLPSAWPPARSPSCSPACWPRGCPRSGRR